MTRLRPVLDDVTYADLVAQARLKIPALAPDWTDHNPGDPGITLVELFAWLAEMLVYQADQLPPDRTDEFLTLLNGPGWTRTTDLDTAVRDTLATLRGPGRAVTADDVVRLLIEVWSAEDASRTPLRRAHGVAGRDLAVVPAGDVAAPGHLSIVIVPEPAPVGGGLPVATPELCAAVHEWLEPRRLGLASGEVGQWSTLVFSGSQWVRITIGPRSPHNIIVVRRRAGVILEGQVFVPSGTEGEWVGRYTFHDPANRAVGVMPPYSRALP